LAVRFFCSLDAYATARLFVVGELLQCVIAGM